MPIGPKKLLELVSKKKLVENLSDRELTNPEGAGFDLRIGEVYKFKSKSLKAYLGEDERQTPEVNLIAKYKTKKDSVVLKPGDYVLFKTLEEVNLPKNICAHIYARGTLYRSGVLFLQSQASPGYCGGLTFGLKNLGNVEVKIDMGARVCHIQFEYIDGGGNSYRGQWQGGRVAAIKREKQV